MHIFFQENIYMHIIEFWIASETKHILCVADKDGKGGIKKEPGVNIKKEGDADKSDAAKTG